jgi:hypothetical protein
MTLGSSGVDLAVGVILFSLDDGLAVGWVAVDWVVFVVAAVAGVESVDEVVLPVPL